MTDRILLVDDDPSLRRVLEINLAARGYQADLAATGMSALQLAGRQPDVIVLDLGLPDMDGLDVIARLRVSSAVPIVVISARDLRTAEVAALSAGADDYINKPFDIEQLMAAIRAALRAPALSGDTTTIVTPDFSIDLTARRVTCRDREVTLTATQWHLVEALARQRGELVSRSQLLEEVWGPGHTHKAYYLRIFIAQIRDKLEPDPSRPTYFLADNELDYRLSV
jgi:two-component system, OmpR family, KDP operon response regulator KdpE